MRSQWVRSGLCTVAVGVLLVISGGYVSALTSQSSNYQATDTHFGPHSTDGSCSGTYCSEVSIGSGGVTPQVGASPSFHTVPDQTPTLDLSVVPGKSNLGVLSTDAIAYKTMTVSVRSQLSGGYTLQMVGDAPHVGSHYLHTSASPVAAQPGHEQFGINVVKNTSPQVGAEPDQVSKGGGGIGGVVAAHYATANKFMYQSDDLIASSHEQSSQTTYTVSMIIAISGSTVPGHYTGDFHIVMMPGF